MLHLNFLYLIFKSSPLKSLILLIAFMASLNAVIFQREVREVVLSSKKGLEQRSFFNALIESGVDRDKITRKLKNLPGIQGIVFKDSEQIKSKVESLTRQLDFDVPETIRAANFYALKVIVDETVKAQKLELIQDYLTQIFGKSKVTIGALKSDIPTTKKANFIEKYFQYILIGSTLTFLILLFLTQGEQIFKNAYLIEKYQRKKKIFETSFFTFFIFLTFLNLGICFYLYKIPTVNLTQALVLGISFTSIVLFSYQVNKRKLC